MKIALINTTKPEPGTGDKATEYTYQLYKHLSKDKNNHADLVYAINETKAANTIGLIYANTVFRSKIPELIKKKYDIIHITNQEVGFAAKILREKGEKCVIITTLHDTLRMRNDLHRGIKQKLYSNLTTLNIRNALESSDLIIFEDQNTRDEVKSIHEIKDDALVPLGINDSIIKTPLKKKSRGKFVVGFIGDFLSSNKNLMIMLKTAELLKNDKNFVFEIYEGGPEQESLKMYKISNELDNVKFDGFVNDSNLVETLDKFDVFVYPALGEAYSQRILEAFGRGIPVVIDSRAKYVDEIKKRSMHAKDEHHLVDVLKELKHKKNSKMIESALKYAKSLTWNKTVEETFKIYNNLVK